MTYTALNALFLLTIGLSLLITRQRPKKALWCTLAVILVMTAFFDSLIIISGIVGYDAEKILGVYIWKAPIEDFAYSVASVGMVGLMWDYFEEREQKE